MKLKKMRLPVLIFSALPADNLRNTSRRQNPPMSQGSIGLRSDEHD
jgi:hypothetical protein